MSNFTSRESVGVLDRAPTVERTDTRGPRLGSPAPVTSTRGLRPTSSRDSKHVTRVLVVEDDVEMVSMLRTFLSAEGYDVEVASNCSGALELASTTSPDIVLLDIVLGK
jgi:PleD family two-component response regulator